MRVAGDAAIRGAPERVWAALRDPDVLARCIPGCQRLETTGPGTCRLTISATVASTTGTYTGEAKLTRHTPDSLTVTASLAGAPGTIDATIRASLTEFSDGTNISYNAETQLTGQIAAVGRLLLTSAANRQANQFFESLTAELATPEPGRSPAGAAGVASPTAPSTRGVSGNTALPHSAPRQPAVRLGSGPAPAPAPAVRTFAGGVLAGAALTLAAVILARRRTHR